MAIYHLEAKMVSRGVGRSAVAAAAYREDRSVQRREDRWGMGAAAPYPLQLRRGH